MKKQFFNTFYVGLIFLLISVKAYALVPLESLVLGDFSSRYTSQKDPLDYIFSREDQLKNYNEKTQLALYRGFYEEGKNLINSCNRPYEVKYFTSWQKSQNKRAIGATIQYFSLDLLSRSIPQYAKYFDFNEVEFKNLIENLVGNYCSQNLSIISKKTLIKNFELKFKNESDFKLPTVEGNRLFSKDLKTIQSDRQSLEQEFKFAIELFKSACSWSGSSDEFGLMTPFVKNPAIYAFLMRNMEGVELEWLEKKNQISKKRTDKVLNIWCENLICRRVEPKKFKQSFNFMIGSNNLSEDLKKLYCEEFLNLDYDLKAVKDERIIAQIKQRGIEDENFLSSYLISLLTGVPDFIIRSKNLNELEEVFRSGVDAYWTDWAKTQLENIEREVYFEEPMTIDLLDQKNFPDSFDSKIILNFGINLGEIDKSVGKIGRVKTQYKFKLPRALLEHIRNVLFYDTPNFNTESYNLLRRIETNLEKVTKDIKERFIVVPWSGDFNRFLALSVLNRSVGKNQIGVNKIKGNEIDVLINFYYGPFALKSIKYQRDIINNKKQSNVP